MRGDAIPLSQNVSILMKRAATVSLKLWKKIEPAKKIQNTGKYEEGKRLLKEYFGR